SGSDGAPDGLEPDGSAGADGAVDGAADAGVTPDVPGDQAPPPDLSGLEAGGGPLLDGGSTFLEATLIVNPTAYSFAMTQVGGQSAPVKFTITNIGRESTGPISHVID